MTDKIDGETNNTGVIIDLLKKKKDRNQQTTTGENQASAVDELEELVSKGKELFLSSMEDSPNVKGFVSIVFKEKGPEFHFAGTMNEIEIIGALEYAKNSFFLQGILPVFTGDPQGLPDEE